MMLYGKNPSPVACSLIKYSRVPVIRPKGRSTAPGGWVFRNFKTPAPSLPFSSAGLKRIYEGRLARRRVILENKDNGPAMGTLIDHESQA